MVKDVREFFAITWLFLALILVELTDGAVAGAYTLVALYITFWLTRREVRRWRARRAERADR